MRLRKGITYVFIANFINLVVNATTGFLLPNILSISTYANISLFQLYITYIGILHFGYSDGMYLKYGGRNINDIDRQEIYDEFKTFKRFQLFITLIAIIISLLLNNVLLLLCAISILPINIGNYLRNLYQATGKFDVYAKFTNINTILIFLINIILLFALKSNYYISYIIGYIVAYFAYWIFLEIEIGKIIPRTKATTNIKYIFTNIKDGILLMLGNFCAVLFTSIDRLFVERLMGLTSFAYFSFAVSIQSLINVFITPVTIVLYNYFCKHKEKEKILLIKNSTLIVVSILITSAFIVRFIIENYITKYNNSIPIIFILFAAQYFSIIVQSIFNNLYKAQKRQKRYFSVIAIVIALSVILNIIFYVINQSIISIALSTLTTSIVWFLVGESDFSEYKYSIKQFLYIFLMIITFLISGIFMQPAIGLIVYCSILILSTYTLMNKELRYISSEFIELLNKIVTKLANK